MYLLAFKISVVAYVYSVVLTEPGMILSKWYQFLESKNLPEWIFKPLVDCCKCVSGQWALWIYLFWCDSYNPLEHVFLICLTIFFVILIDKIYTWN